MKGDKMWSQQLSQAVGHERILPLFPKVVNCLSTYNNFKNITDNYEYERNLTILKVNNLKYTCNKKLCDIYTNHMENIDHVSKLGTVTKLTLTRSCQFLIALCYLSLFILVFFLLLLLVIGPQARLKATLSIHN